MQIIVMYATSMYSWLTKISCEYEFLILYTYHPHAVCLREQGCEDPWLFFEAKRGSAKKKTVLGYILP